MQPLELSRIHQLIQDQIRLLHSSICSDCYNHHLDKKRRFSELCQSSFAAEEFTPPYVLNPVVNLSSGKSTFSLIWRKWVPSSGSGCGPRTVPIPKRRNQKRGRPSLCQLKKHAVPWEFEFVEELELHYLKDLKPKYDELLKARAVLQRLLSGAGTPYERSFLAEAANKSVDVNGCYTMRPAYD